jgi:hypothetical protein
MDYVLLEVNPGEDDFNTIPHFEIYFKADYENEFFDYSVAPIARIVKENGKLSYFNALQNFEEDDPLHSMTYSQLSTDKSVAMLARMALGLDSRVFKPQLILGEI